MKIDKRDLAKLIASPAARQAAELVSFESLNFGTADERIAAWGAVITVCLHSRDEADLNRWWRIVMPDAAWRTAETLKEFANFKIKDIRICSS